MPTIHILGSYDIIFIVECSLVWYLVFHLP